MVEVVDQEDEKPPRRKVTAEDVKADLHKWLVAYRERAERTAAAFKATALPNEAVVPASLGDAQHAVDAEITHFFDRATTGEENFQQAVIATPGIGKTKMVLDATRTWVRGMAKVDATLDETADGPLRPGKPWHLSPTVRLAENSARIYGEDAAVIRGRTYGLGKADAAEPLCARAEAVAEATKAGVHAIATAFCRGEDEKGVVHVCPHRAGCPWWAQFDRAQGAEIVCATHDQLTITMSRQMMPAPSVVIIDESPLGTLVAKTRWFPLDVARKSAGAHLATLEVVLAALAEGNDPRDALRALKPETEDACTDPGPRPWTKLGLGKIAAELEGADKLQLHPGLSDKEVRARLKVVKNKPYAAMLLRHVAAEWTTEQPLRGVTYNPKAKFKSKDDGMIEMPMIQLQHRKHLRIAAKVPVLLLDGTAEGELLRAVWPNIEVANIEAPRHMRLTQVVGRTFSASSFFGRDHKPTAPGRARAEEIVAYLTTLPVPGVLVAQKEVVAMLKLPEGWKGEHFGAIRGLDDHRDVASIVVVGRTLMRATEAERITRALFYDRKVPLVLDKKYTKRHIQLPGRDTFMWDWRHPDPLVDLIRAAAAEREIEQAVDRARLVHRTGAPCQVVLIGEVPTRLPIDTIVRYADAMHDKIAIAMRRDGFLPLRATWLAQCHPELWATAEAAEHAIRRAVPGTDVCVWRFRVAGQRGPRPTLCWAATGADKAAVLAYLVAKVGHVTTLELDLGSLGFPRGYTAKR